MTFPQEPPPEEEDASLLVPIILGVIGTYLATKGSLAGPKAAVAADLKILELGGAAMEQIARRALERLIRRSGRDGKELWPFVETSVQISLRAGVSTLVDIVRATPVPGQGIQKAGTPVGKKPRPPLPGQAWTDLDRDGKYELAPVNIDGLTPAELRRVSGDFARTVVNTAVDAAAKEAKWFKTWHTQKDVRVRSSHKTLEGRKVPATRSFRADISLHYPHDPAAPMNETAGCRCSVAFSKR